MKHRNRLLLLLALLLTAFGLVAAQDAAAFQSVGEFRAALASAVNDGSLDTFWDRLAGQIPLVIGGEVVFLYRGEAESVEWRGDFNSWQGGEDWQGERVADSDVWLLAAEFPTDARVEYKIVLDGEAWILDPANPRESEGGFGTNSELAMPEYEPTPYATARDDVPAGRLTPAWTLNSHALRYTVNYQVYTPAGYSDLDNLPVIYVTDGQEYISLAGMPTVLDNLIAEGQIRPLIAVFIDSRSPDDPNENRREREFIENPRYAEFAARELVPLIDALYRTDRSRDARAILGTSLGGLNAAYFGITYPNVFGLVAAQSPAFWAQKHLANQWATAGEVPLAVFMSNGYPAWDAALSDIRPMRDLISQDKDVPLKFVQTNQGHAWGNWRDLLPDMLMYFFGM